MATTLLQGDCLERMKEIPDRSVDMVLTDPPYNIGVVTQKNNKQTANQWDKIDGYIDWCISWLLECQRVLKPTGVLYFFHNDMKQIAELLCEIKKRTSLEFISFCIWDKGSTYRSQTWRQRDPNGKTALRSWFNICEYCLHFFNAPANADMGWKQTGLDCINSNPECYKPLKEWYRQEKKRLGLTNGDIAQRYTEVTGKKPYMLRHYFQNSQFEIPTKKVFETIYEPIGFEFVRGEQRGYEALRQEYEALRNVHICDQDHCNIWHIPPIPSNNRFHTCQKPVELLERLCRVSTKDGGIVLDPFMGSGSTGVSCINTKRDFIGIELDKGYFEIAKRRLEEVKASCGRTNQTDHEALPDPGV